MDKLNTVVEVLGYSQSKNYIQYEDIIDGDCFDFHWTKILSILQPDAVYTIDNLPFILFFSETKSIDFKTIWNAQVPFVFVLREDTVYVYNGKKITTNTKKLEELEKRALEDIQSTTFSYWNLTNETFLTSYKNELSGNQLNNSLLQNIKTLTSKMKYEFEIPFATKLVLRIIFIRYLIDRGVNLGYKNFGSDIEKNQEEFLKTLRSKRDLYELFKYLKRKFNGNLFELGEEVESKSLKPQVFDVISDFISGNLILEDGQLSLFPMYDFNIISVELISNIYEILLGNEGQQENKSFYTPSYLVDYILSKTVDYRMKTEDTCKILDPSCGSGIFLVKSYRRIVEKRLKNRGNKNTDEILIDVLKKNIYGVDLSSEAIDVSIFSLYLTILDYKNPKDLENFKLPDLIDTNLFISDFFDEKLKNKIIHLNFDFILGNPPWGKIKGKTDEISKDFIFELSNYLEKDTICSLVLPSKLLYNHGKSFKKLREFFLEENLLEEVLELSPVRKEIFKNANAPAMIITYKKNLKNIEQALRNEFTHISLKPNVYFELFDILAIEKNDIKFIKQNLLYENDWAWKVLLYGTSWDLEICFKLKKKFNTIENVIDEKNSLRDTNEIILGTGIQMGTGVDATAIIGMPLLDSRKGMSKFFLDMQQTVPFDKESVHRIRNPKIFEAPYCLIKKGIDMKTYELKAAYSEENFLFQETIRAIKGGEEDRTFLKAITGIFNSSLSAYINTILGSSVGIEREQVFFEEALKFPFFNNEKIICDVADIVDEIQLLYKDNNSLFEDRKLIELKKNLDKAVLEGFDLKDNSFVDYVINIQIPMIRKEKAQLGNRKVIESELLDYAKEFQNYFINSYSSYGYGIEISISTNLANQFVAFELNINESISKNSIEFMQVANFEKELISKFAIKSHTDSFFTVRDSIVFEDTSFYIIKKNLLKNWHPAMAKRDLAEVIDKILTGEEA
ncbi:MAG: N-6 DNA methylase [Carnobacterium maltaromaticum]